MIRSTSPAAIIARYGPSSVGLQVFVTSATPKSVFVDAEPRPGKCFSAVRTPASRWALTSVVASRVTAAGSAENERPSAPIAGLSGLTSRSTTGARLRLIPTEASVVAIDRAHASIALSPFVAISCSPANAGKPVAGDRRATRPPS